MKVKKLLTIDMVSDYVLDILYRPIYVSFDYHSDQNFDFANLQFSCEEQVKILSISIGFDGLYCNLPFIGLNFKKGFKCTYPQIIRRMTHFLKRIDIQVENEKSKDPLLSQLFPFKENRGINYF